MQCAQEILKDHKGKSNSESLHQKEVLLRENLIRICQKGLSPQRIIDELLKLDINSMPPVETLTKLHELLKKASE